MTDTIEEIRARHEAAEKDGGHEWCGVHGPGAHADRATLLRALDEAQERAEPWTDDDQRGLNAAVADAMWYWDDMPMDPDDAISLTGILKDCLQENGFQIVRKDEPK